MEKYLNLITSLYRDKPKFMAWLEAGLQKGEDVAELARNIHTYFDLDTAVGKQLDILGEFIGRKRVLDFQPSGGYSPVMGDSTYRFALKAKVLINIWDGMTPSIYSYWDEHFPEYHLEIYDNQDMSMDVLLVGNVGTLVKDLLEHGYLFPKPETVRINLTATGRPLFAYDMDTPAMKGYDRGYWQGGGLRADSYVFAYGDEDDMYKGYGEGEWS
ncbi:DUF2612 domain-containing protein [Sporomusa sp. KB1]|jgi:hypothetical protein|uniref:DUF2612 domain-containing protein n=1 Tax=Sporomusa sp. KB1 TaxID=943346 RepID=UPI0011A9F626|nr:DUF2612 domain-containing protein [Sporomusa sp. KB1]TWH46322.1 uncharacterized protein DUF2612 [Sporomusa sp. KB1]